MKESKVGFIKFNVSLMNDYELKVGETLVYGALVSFRNMSIQSNTKDGQGEVYAYPPISSVANITGQSERSVKSHIQVLEQKGLMTVKRSYKEGSKEKNVNRYYLNIEVLEVYFNANTKMTKSVKTAKPKTTNAKETIKELRQKEFITDTSIDKWFTHYQGEHNNNSAKKINLLAEKYGAETVVKAIHNAMKGVNIDTLSQGSTGLILSRLNTKNLEDAKIQLKYEQERQERFFKEPIKPSFDYTTGLKRKEKKETRPVVEDIHALFGVGL
ncbi:helix-turn-helix domain-containing protein [Peribacillus frigoritolerans]|uniref:helix-turn-helix domain-containing protein n=1 Tax=Peribacillus frigoritolerans TaxID=450367 RepID=UPI002417F651|nr:helix-turn-helix domain-containing protein [Peribacillus frigoritolerans]MDG4850808.1 helix-turn-helix domain-containing protein [Peribacillus frigoritolerans]